MDPNAVVRYAKFSDASSNEFKTSQLSDKQNGEQTYQLLITGDVAEYRVADDPKAQDYALHNYEYLSGACDIQGQAQENSRITTLKNGTLTKSTGGNWRIENRAIIKFS